MGEAVSMFLANPVTHTSTCSYLVLEVPELLLSAHVPQTEGLRALAARVARALWTRVKQ